MVLKMAMIIKQRGMANQISHMDLVDDVDGCDCIIVDDIIDTVGPLWKAGSELKKRSATLVTHSLFSKSVEKYSYKILQLSAAQLLATDRKGIHFESKSRFSNIYSSIIPISSRECSARRQ